MLSSLYRAFFNRLRGFGFGFGIFNRFHGWMWREKQPESMTLNGAVICLPRHDLSVGHRIAVDGYYEPEITALLRSLLKPGMTFLDIGANIGYYTLLAAVQVQAKGRVFAFEPDLNSLNYLLRSLEKNRFSHVTVFPFAAGESLGLLPLYTQPEHFGNTSLMAKANEASQATTTVITVPLDQLISQTPPAVAKMDIEGAELSALRGAQTLLKNPVWRHLILEMNPAILARIGVAARDIDQLLEASGFHRQKQIDADNVWFSKDAAP